jgi:4-hydroxybenzoate polyprenyltransferase
VIAIYPFMKRITYWPQTVLGLAFSWGALMGWPALAGSLDLSPLLLYAGSIFWVIGYDTIYAHQDREDDALVGIKSTALLFETRTKPMLGVCYGLSVLLLALALWSAGAGAISAIGLAAFAAHLAWQVSQLDISDAGLCLRLFKSNRDAGLLLFAAIAIEAVLRH